MRILFAILLVASFVAADIEPNNTTLEANFVDLSTPKRIRGSVFPNADIDIYSFDATAGNRLSAATMTSFSASGSNDSVLTVYLPDGVTVLESDDNDGTFGPNSSSISGRVLPVTGRYFIEVKHFSTTNTLRPYDLYLNRFSGESQSEIEPNSSVPTANSLFTHVTGVVSDGVDGDFYTLDLNAGDTVFLSLDMDPERNGVTFDGRLSFRPAESLLTSNDSSVVSPNSEAFFYTVQSSGTYLILVDASGGAGNPNATYRLSYAVYPQSDRSGCSTFTNNTGLALPTGPAAVEQAINVSNAPRVGKMTVSFDLTHSFFADLDVTLVSPDGAEVALFTDVGPTNSASQTFSFTLDDEGAIPLNAFTALRNGILTPELNSRLEWFNGTNPNGAWTLKFKDDATGDGGQLNSWSITICPQDSVCAPGYIPSVLYTEDFESSDGGYTHTGVQDEWEYGLPSGTPIASCNSGSNCWATDLDNTYNVNSDQSLKSPPINLAGVVPPVILSFAQKYNIESASFDKYTVVASEVGNPSLNVPSFIWTGATMNATVGNPAQTIQESSAWGEFHTDISALAGKLTELEFKLTSDTTVQLYGVAIDDVKVTACLIDSDLDGIPDQNDGCPFDPSKNAPLICGCGVVETDLNANGIFDCKVNDELKLLLNDTKKKLKKVKLESTKRTRKKFKAASKKASEYGASVQGALSVSSGFNIASSLKSVKSLSKKVLKLDPANFDSSKRKLNSRLKKFLKALS